MPSITVPGIGIEAEWPLGENGWNIGMDANLRKLSMLTQLSVPSITAPLSTSAGVQIAPASHANAFQVAVHVGSWHFYQPFEGLRAYVRDTSSWHVYRTGLWVREASAAYVISNVVTASRLITESELAMGATIEVNSTDDVTLTVPGPSTNAPYLGASLNRRPITIIRTGTGGVSVNGAAGSTLISAEDAFSARAQGSAMAVIPLLGDRYSVQGDVE